MRLAKDTYLKRFFLAVSIAAFIFFTIIFSLSYASWLHTFKVYNNNDAVADLYVSKKIIKDGKPTFTVRYLQYNSGTVLSSFLGLQKKNATQEIKAELVGDGIVIFLDTLTWNSSVQKLHLRNGIRPYSLKSDYLKSGSVYKYGADEFIVNTSGTPFLVGRNALVSRIQSPFVPSFKEDRMYNIQIADGKVVVSEK